MARERVASSNNHTSRANKPILKVQIMVVDDDNTSLSIVSTMLKRCNEQGNMNIELVVFSFDNPLDALATLRANKNRFDLIVTDLHMPDMNGMDLQKYVYEEFKIPVIIMSSDDKDSVIIQSLEEGASFFLVKPVTKNDLRNVWQYAVTAKKGKSIAAHADDDDDDNNGGTSSSDSDKISVDKDDRISASSVNETTKVFKKNNDNKKVIGKKRSKDAGNDNDEDDDHDDVNPSAPKKAKVVWTNSLHNRFLQAISHIGLDKAVPKKILEFMNVAGLTRENVASHLQKYRIFLKRVRERVRNTPRNFSERPNTSTFASSLTLDNLPQDYTRSAGSLIQSQPSHLAFHPGSGFNSATQGSSSSSTTTTTFASALALSRQATYAPRVSNTSFVPDSVRRMPSLMHGSSSSSTLNQQLNYGGSGSVYNNQANQPMIGTMPNGAMVDTTNSGGLVNIKNSVSRYRMEGQDRLNMLGIGGMVRGDPSNIGIRGSNGPIRMANPVSAIGNIESSNYNSLMINMSSADQFRGQNNNNNNNNYVGFRVAGDGSIAASGAPLQLNNIIETSGQISNHCPSNSGAIGNGSNIGPRVVGMSSSSAWLGRSPHQLLQPPNLPNIVEENTSLLPVFPPNNLQMQSEAPMFNAIDVLLEASENINNNHNNQILHNQDLQVQGGQQVVDTNSNIMVNDRPNQGLYPAFEQHQENGELVDFELGAMFSAGNNLSSVNLPNWDDEFIDSLLGDDPF